MRKITMTLLFLSILTGSYAQHCPFDGSAAVVIRDLSKQYPGSDQRLAFILVETDTAKADSCTYAAGALHLPFGTIDEELIKKYNGGWESRAALYVKETAFNEKGYWVVVLNQAQTYCMLKRGNDFDFKTRHFEIQVKRGGQLIKTIPVLPESIYQLCTSAGKWSRIVPVEIALPD